MGKKKLSDIRIEFISLVENPANGMEIVWKSNHVSAASGSRDNGIPESRKEWCGAIKKSDDEKHLVFATVYEPGTVDSQGDFAEADEIEKAAHLFLGEYRQEFVDTEHNQRMNGSIVVESFIKRGSVEEYPDTKDGAWCVVIKVRDVDTWDKIKNGEIAGVSMFGSAMKTEVEKTAGEAEPQNVNEITEGAASESRDNEIAESRLDLGGAINKAVKGVKDFILGNNNQPKAKENEMNEAEVKKAIEDAITPKDAEIAELKKTVEQQGAEIEELKKAAVGRATVDPADGGEPKEINSAF